SCRLHCGACSSTGRPKPEARRRKWPWRRPPRPGSFERGSSADLRLFVVEGAGGLPCLPGNIAQVSRSRCDGHHKNGVLAITLTHVGGCGTGGSSDQRADLVLIAAPAEAFTSSAMKDGLAAGPKD